MPSIIFVAPGLGKSELVKRYPDKYIDCDSVIERATGRTVTELSKTVEWGEIKASILEWWQEFYPSHILLVGKDRFIKDADVVYLHDSIEEMQKRLASSTRENPIYDWNCYNKDTSYILQALQHGKKIVRVVGYISDILEPNNITNHETNSLRAISQLDKY